MDRIKLSDKPDAVIIGSGAAGSLMADRLTRAGKSVLILEAGPARGMKDLTSSQIWARKLKWGGAPVLDEGRHGIGHNFNNGWGTGGAAMHHYGVWPRLHPEDFRVRSEHKQGWDWPISYEDLRPYYDRIQQEVGVSGDAEQEVWRPESDDYPEAPVPAFPQARFIAEGFSKLGMRTAPMPLAVLTKDRPGRQACIWDGWCDAGCPTGALANPLALYLKNALLRGATLVNQAVATRIETNAAGDRITGVHYVDEQAKTRFIEASVVILAASTVQNSRLLLASGTDKLAGLANQSGRVGQDIMVHLACQVFGLFEQETQPHLGVTGGQLISQEHYDGKRKGSAFGSYQWLIGNALKPNGLLGIGNSRPDIYGKSLQPFMRKAAKHMAIMTGVAEELPLAKNRVTLSETRDKYGLPLAVVNHNTPETSLALWEQMRQQGIKVFEAAGADEVWNGNMAPMHNLGGTPMGNDAKASVANSYGQAHDQANLYIAGSSLFPTGGGVNPTFTLHALTLRSVEQMLEQWSEVAA